MELKIYSPQDTGFIQKIDWNYDELKKEIAAAIESYANSVYTDDMIKKAKEDRAKLNKVSDALKKERTRIRKKLLEPDEQFGKEVQEITGMYALLFLYCRENQIRPGTCDHTVPELPF